MPATATDRLYGLTTSVAVKPPCLVATTANLTLSGLQTVDGVVLEEDDRVLVKNQTDTTTNGIYEASTSGWSRARDFDGARDAVDGTLVIVRAGTTNGNTIWELTATNPVQIGDDALTFRQALLDDSATAAFIAAGTGAGPRTAQAKMREIISANDFYANGSSGALVAPGVTNNYPGIQAALDYAGTFVITNADEESQQSGGLTVWLGHGEYDIADTPAVPPGVSFKGAGQFSTVLRNLTTNKSLLRNSLGAVYNTEGTEISDIGLYGARTSNAQWGVDLLRGINTIVRNVFMQNMGAGNLRVRQSICCLFDNVVGVLSAGPGILTGEGVVSWSDSTPNNLPTNDCIFFNCHMKRNDGAGVKLGPYTNGCLVQSGAYEYNYFTAGANVGYNIELVNNGSFMPNDLVDVWVEGPVQCHVYQNTTIDVTNRVTRLRHFGNGAAGNVDRAVIVNGGTLILESPSGHGGSYKLIAGSISPFRVVPPNAIIYLNDARGSTLTNGDQWVENAAGTGVGLENYLFQDVFGTARGNVQRTYMDSGAVATHEHYRTGDTQPFIRHEPLTKTTAYGPGGTTAPDVRVGRRAAGIWGPPIGAAAMGLGVDGLAGATMNFSNGIAPGAVAVTMGAGPTGATAGNPVGWLRINVSGTDRIVPYWALP